MATIATTTSRSMTLLINDIIGGGYGATSVTISEMSDGTLRFDVKSPNGDLRGFALDFLNETLLKGMTATTLDGTMTAQLWGDDNLTKAAANDVNFSGQVANATGGLDAIMTFGTEGASKDYITNASFLLKSASGPMTLDILAGAWLATRVTSLTTYDANGKVLTTGDSSKDAEQIGMNLFDAKNDTLTVDEDATGAINVFANDLAAKGAVVTQWYLNGVALKGNTYTDVKTSTVFTFNSDGTITADATNADILRVGEQAIFNFSYDAKAADGADMTTYVSDHADVKIIINGLDNDNAAPVLTNVSAEGVEGRAFRVNLAAATTDDKGDTDTFALAGAPAYVIRDLNGNLVDAKINTDGLLVVDAKTGMLTVNADSPAIAGLHANWILFVNGAWTATDQLGQTATANYSVSIAGVQSLTTKEGFIEMREGFDPIGLSLFKSGYVTDLDLGAKPSIVQNGPTIYQYIDETGKVWDEVPFSTQGLVFRLTPTGLIPIATDGRFWSIPEGAHLVGTINYTATMNFPGMSGTPVTGVIHLDITGVDDVLDLGNHAIQADEGSAAQGAFTVTDRDFGETAKAFIADIAIDASFLGGTAGETVHFAAGDTINFANGAALVIDAQGNALFDASNVKEAAEGETVHEDILLTWTDAHGHAVADSVSTLIVGHNDAPIFTTDISLTADGSAAMDNVLNHATDFDHGAVISALSLGGNLIDAATGEARVDLANGSYLTLNADGTLTAVAGDTLLKDTTLTGSVEVVVTDEHGATATANLTYTLVGQSNPNTAPVAVDAALDVMETGRLNIFADQLASDAQGDHLTFFINGKEVHAGDIIALDSGALLSMNDDGSFGLTPNGASNYLWAGEDRLDSFSFQVTDGTLTSETATATITIHGEKTSVVANADALRADENFYGTVNLYTNDQINESSAVMGDHDNALIFSSAIFSSDFVKGIIATASDGLTYSTAQAAAIAVTHESSAATVVEAASGGADGEYSALSRGQLSAGIDDSLASASNILAYGDTGGGDFTSLKADSFSSFLQQMQKSVISAGYADGTSDRAAAVGISGDDGSARTATTAAIFDVTDAASANVMDVAMVAKNSPDGAAINIGDASLSVSSDGAAALAAGVSDVAALQSESSSALASLDASTFVSTNENGVFFGAAVAATAYAGGQWIVEYVNTSGIPYVDQTAGGNDAFDGRLTMDELSHTDSIITQLESGAILAVNLITGEAVLNDEDIVTALGFSLETIQNNMKAWLAALGHAGETVQDHSVFLYNFMDKLYGEDGGSSLSVSYVIPDADADAVAAQASNFDAQVGDFTSGLAQGYMAAANEGVSIGGGLVSVTAESLASGGGYNGGASAATTLADNIKTGDGAFISDTSEASSNAYNNASAMTYLTNNINADDYASVNTASQAFGNVQTDSSAVLMLGNNINAGNSAFVTTGGLATSSAFGGSASMVMLTDNIDAGDGAFVNASGWAAGSAQANSSTTTMMIDNISAGDGAIVTTGGDTLGSATTGASTTAIRTDNIDAGDGSTVNTSGRIFGSAVTGGSTTAMLTNNIDTGDGAIVTTGGQISGRASAGGFMTAMLTNNIDTGDGATVLAENQNASGDAQTAGSATLMLTDNIDAGYQAFVNVNDQISDSARKGGSAIVMLTDNIGAGDWASVTASNQASGSAFDSGSSTTAMLTDNIAAGDGAIISVSGIVSGAAQTGGSTTAMLTDNINAGDGAIVSASGAVAGSARSSGSITTMLTANIDTGEGAYVNVSDRATGSASIGGSMTAMLTDNIDTGDGAAVDANGQVSGGASNASSATVMLTNNVDTGDSAYISTNGVVSGSAALGSSATVMLTNNIDTGDGAVVDASGAVSGSAINSSSATMMLTDNINTGDGAYISAGGTVSGSANTNSSATVMVTDNIDAGDGASVNTSGAASGSASGDSAVTAMLTDNIDAGEGAAVNTDGRASSDASDDSAATAMLTANIGAGEGATVNAASQVSSGAEIGAAATASATDNLFADTVAYVNAASLASGSARGDNAEATASVTDNIAAGEESAISADASASASANSDVESLTQQTSAVSVGEETDAFASNSASVNADSGAAATATAGNNIFTGAGASISASSDASAAADSSAAALLLQANTVDAGDGALADGSNAAAVSADSAAAATADSANNISAGDWAAVNAYSSASASADSSAEATLSQVNSVYAGDQSSAGADNAATASADSFAAATASSANNIAAGDEASVNSSDSAAASANSEAQTVVMQENGILADGGASATAGNNASASADSFAAASAAASNDALAGAGTTIDAYGDATANADSCAEVTIVQSNTVTVIGPETAAANNDASAGADSSSTAMAQTSVSAVTADYGGDSETYGNSSAASSSCNDSTNMQTNVINIGGDGGDGGGTSNQAPVFGEVLASGTEGQPFILDLNNYAKDPEGSSLTFAMDPGYGTPDTRIYGPDGGDISFNLADFGVDPNSLISVDAATGEMAVDTNALGFMLEGWTLVVNGAFIATDDQGAASNPGLFELSIQGLLSPDDVNLS